MNELPLELLFAISDKLPVKSFLQLLCTCKLFNQLLGNTNTRVHHVRKCYSDNVKILLCLEQQTGMWREAILENIMTTLTRSEMHLVLSSEIPLSVQRKILCVKSIRGRFTLESKVLEEAVREDAFELAEAILESTAVHMEIPFKNAWFIRKTMDRSRMPALLINHGMLIPFEHSVAYSHDHY